MSRRMWEAVETKAERDRIAEVERRREKRRGGKKIRRKGNGKEIKKEKTKGRKDNRCKESGGRMGDLGWGKRGSKVRGRSEKAGSRKIS